MNKEMELEALVDRIGQLNRLTAHLQLQKSTLELRLNRLMATHEVTEVKGRWYETARMPGRPHPLIIARPSLGDRIPFLESKNVVTLNRKNPNSMK